MHAYGEKVSRNWICNRQEKEVDALRMTMQMKIKKMLELFIRRRHQHLQFVQIRRCKHHVVRVQVYGKQWKISNWKFVHLVCSMKSMTRVQFCEWIQQQLQEDIEIMDRIIWIDEATFKLNGHVNLHNSVYYSTENLHLIRENNNLSPGISVWGEEYVQLVYWVLTSLIGRSISFSISTPLLDTDCDIWMQDGAPLWYNSTWFLGWHIWEVHGQERNHWMASTIAWPLSLWLLNVYPEGRRLLTKVSWRCVYAQSRVERKNYCWICSSGQWHGLVSANLSLYPKNPVV